MMLVIGARASGKYRYVRGLGYAESDISDGEINDRRVVYNLQNIVFADPSGSAMLLEQLLQKEVVVCDEVGSGVIPVDQAQREAREATGRLCCRLAEQAETVVRIVCGIATVIKG